MDTCTAFTLLMLTIVSCLFLFFPFLLFSLSFTFLFYCSPFSFTFLAFLLFSVVEHEQDSAAPTLTLQCRNSSSVSSWHSHSVQTGNNVVCVSIVQETWWFKCKLLALLCQHSRRTQGTACRPFCSHSASGHCSRRLFLLCSGCLGLVTHIQAGLSSQ